MNDADHATGSEGRLQFAIALRLALIALGVMIVQRLLRHLRPTRSVGPLVRRGPACAKQGIS